MQRDDHLAIAWALVEVMHADAWTHLEAMAGEVVVWEMHAWVQVREGQYCTCGVHKPEWLSNLNAVSGPVAHPLRYPACMLANPLPSTALASVASADGARRRLREATVELHARVDRLFPDGLDRLELYRGYVLGMHRFAIDLEVVAGLSPRQSCWLAKDLVALSLHPLPPRGVRRPMADHAARLGWEYVMAGSSRGARMLVRDSRRLGLDAGNGARFIETHAADNDEWPALLARLDALDVADTSRMARAECGARDAFTHVHACLRQAFDTLCLPQEETRFPA